MMNQEGIFKKVGQILNELQDQYDFLAQNPAQFNDLELELFLANANFLSDHVQILRKINSNALQEIQEHDEDSSDLTVAMPKSEALTEIVVEKELKMEKEKTLEELENEYAAENEPRNVENAVHIEEEKEEVKDVQPEPLKFEFLMDNHVESDKFEFEQQSIETIFDRPLSKEEEEIIAEKQRLRASQQVNERVEEVRVSAPVVVVPEPVKIVSEPVKVVQNITPEPAQVQLPEEKVVEQPMAVPPVPETPVSPVFVQPSVIAREEEPSVRPTLNDLLASKNNASSSLIVENSNKAKITDLKQAINLNEKLLYIKDLFNGYNLAYAEAIELINKMPDFETADNFLRNNYAEKNNWAAKQTTVDQFYNLLNQRFDLK